MKTKLKASTILESIIAMVIISAVFSISMMTVERVMNSYRVALDYRVHMALLEVATSTKTTHQFLDRSIDSTDFRIEQSLLPYASYSDVYVLSLKAYSLSDQLIIEWKELVAP